MIPTILVPVIFLCLHDQRLYKPQNDNKVIRGDWVASHETKVYLSHLTCSGLLFGRAKVVWPVIWRALKVASWAGHWHWWVYMFQQWTVYSVSALTHYSPRHIVWYSAELVQSYYKHWPGFCFCLHLLQKHIHIQGLGSQAIYCSYLHYDEKRILHHIVSLPFFFFFISPVFSTLCSIMLI